MSRKRIVVMEPSERLVVRERVCAYRTLGDIPLPPPAKLDVDAVELLIEERERGR